MSLQERKAVSARMKKYMGSETKGDVEVVGYPRSPRPMIIFPNPLVKRDPHRCR